MWMWKLSVEVAVPVAYPNSSAQRNFRASLYSGGWHSRLSTPLQLIETDARRQRQSSIGWGHISSPVGAGRSPGNPLLR